MEIKDIKIGYKLPVERITAEGSEILKAEILGKRKEGGEYEFYVHYIDLNKRLDEWINQAQLKIEDPAKIEIPKKKKKLEEQKEKEKNKMENSKDNEITEIEKKTKKTDEEYRIKNVRKIMFRQYLVDAWYFSPYPKNIAESEIVYICEFCLFYFSNKTDFVEHAGKCQIRHPPGREVYRNEGISFFECDGHKQKEYCRNLSLLSKLFLDHKSLYYDIDVFLFYVLCRHDERGFSIVGYFSKEKISEQGYNLACILTLPFEQRKGYGKILMDFSYILSKKDKLIAGPEKPLSDLGLLSYRAYWLEVIVKYLMDHEEASIEEISKATYISEDDIMGTLCSAGILKLYKGNIIYAISSLHKKKATNGRLKKLDEKYLRRDL